MRMDQTETRQMFIDGEHIVSSSDEWMDVLNPATGRVIERVPAASVDSVHRIMNQRVASRRFKE
jgi:acyl-CoA reductase-like NAD-dependent aldehyde dehydrogenase